MIKYLAAITLAVAVSSTTMAAPSAPNPNNIFLSHYLDDVWGTILDNNDTGKWDQRISDTGVMISTIWRAGCVDDPAICLQIERKYPSGDTVVEFIPFDDIDI